MNQEYFVGYLENPNIIINDDFQTKEVLPVIFEKINNEYYEYKTKEKVFIKNQPVFDGHKFYLSNSSFYGTIYEPISFYEANVFLNNLGESYLKKIYNLKKETKMYSLIKEKEYIETVKDFIETFNSEFKEEKNYARKN